MEYVPGESITACADRLRLDSQQRLQLFIQACEAVHHAHQKAILHRDLKPSNILVTSRGDQRLVVKIIDFGIAKALGERTAGATLYTHRGQLVGTPAYMSPEQADGDSTDVDTRSDIYSLGVVLYELITGALPFEAKTYRLATPIHRDDPPRPSTRLAELPSEDAKRIASDRRSDAGALIGQLRAELEWIPLKAMARDPVERYRSAAELADDVRNYLERRPLIAGPHTAGYRARNFLLKHLRAVFVAAAVVGVILGLMIALAISTRRAVQETYRATQERDRAVAAEATANSERRKSQVLLAEALVDQANVLDAAGGAVAAWEGFARATDAFQQVGLSSRPADIGLMRSYDAHPPPLMTMDGHTEGILGLDLSRDGTVALTASKDGTLRVWDVRGGVDVRILRGHDNWVNGCALSPDGALALSAGDDHTVRCWDVGSGDLLHVLNGHTRPARAVAFCPGGKHVISGSDDGTMRLWDLSSGKELHAFTDHNGGVRSLAVSPDGKFALVGSDGGRDASLTLWNLETFERMRVLDDDPSFRTYNNGVRTIAFVPDGQSVLTAGYDHAVKRWSLFTRQPPEQVVGGTTLLVSVAVTPDGQGVLVGSDDGALRLYDITSGKEIRSYPGFTQPVRGVAVSGDGKAIVAASLDNKIRAWAADGTRESRTVRVEEPYSNAWFTWGHLLIVTENVGNTISIFDAATGHFLKRVGRDNPDVREFLAGDGARLIRRDKPDAITLSRWGESRAALLKIPWDAKRMCNIALSRDGKLVLFAQDDGNVVLWDVETQKPTWTIAGHTGATKGVISPDGSRVMTSGVDNIVHVWEIAARRELCKWPFNGIVQFTFSPDSQTILTGDSAGLVQLWDAGTGSEIRRLVSLGAAIVNVQLHEDGKTALTVSSDSILRLWDAHTGQLAGAFGGTGRLLTWDLSEDGAALLLARQTASREAVLSTFMLDRAGQWRTFFRKRLEDAQGLLRTNPDDPTAQETYGEWYAYRGEHDSAIALFHRAKNNAPALALARSYWNAGRNADAAREFHRAIGLREAAAPYLQLCAEAAGRK
jgi:WD40 repeat protein